MLFTKQAVSFIVVSISLVVANALNPLQALRRNAEYEKQGYRILTNANIHDYTVRIRNTPKSCEEGVQYSGYIDKIDTDDHFFFYFVESRSNPSTDPTVLWLNGGPGCSSMMGLWMEIGPCIVNESGNDTVRNPHSWNTAANLIFLDQPVNVGYSYGKSKVKSTAESARGVYAFLQLFFAEYTQYANSPFHISGESYAGHYLPAISSEIIKNNKAMAGNTTKINYKSMLIGNGWTDPRTQFQYYENYGCSNYTEYQPVLNTTTCEKMKKDTPRCIELMNKCYNSTNALHCASAEVYCEKVLDGVFEKTGLNVYDIRKKCEGDLCYPIIDVMDRYANLESVKKDLGVDPIVGNFTSCSDAVGDRFGMNGDNALDFSGLVAKTLEADIRVLLYAGEMDWICNWVGNLAWSQKMNWRGKQGYIDAPMQDWYNNVTNEHAGTFKTYDNLTFLKVFNAGHMVPFDQRENSLDFFSKWISSLPLNN